MKQKTTDFPGAARCLCGMVRYWWAVRPVTDRASGGYEQYCPTCGQTRKVS